MALVSAKAEAVAGNGWLRSQNAVELRLPVLHSGPATEGGWKGRNVFLKVLNGNAETRHGRTSPCWKGSSTDRRIG